MLLLWSYRELKYWGSGDHYVLSGITFLNARSYITSAAPKILPSINRTVVHDDASTSSHFAHGCSPAILLDLAKFNWDFYRE